MKLIDKVWDINKKYLHSLFQYKEKEIHHIFPRIGVCKCCLLLLYPAKTGHQNDWQWVKSLRETHRELKEEVIHNFIKYFGCKKEIRILCEKCAMPKVGEK